MTRLVWLLPLAAAACAHRGARDSTFERWHCPGDRRFATVYEDLAAGRSERSETVVRCGPAGPGRWAVETRQSGSHGDPSGQQITYGTGPDGLGMVQVRSFGCTFDYDPPVRVFPAVLGRESEWSSVYERFEGTVRGTCRLETATPYCDRGVAVTCRTTQGGHDLVERSHHCPGRGWQGSEGVIFAHGDASARFRTYGDLDHPDPPDAARPYPTLDEIGHPEPAPPPGPSPDCFAPPECDGGCP